LINSLDLCSSDVRRLHSDLAAGPSNRFVGLQLASMAREQLAAVAAAAATGDHGYMQAAAATYFAQLEVEGSIVAAALFYPRSCSNRKQPSTCGQQTEVVGCAFHDSSTAQQAEGCASGAMSAAACCDERQDPHCYVELLVTRQPGRGWGSLLLQHIERHARQHAGGSMAVGGRALRSVKLLSVESVQGFYRRNGYAGPHAESREMCKLLSEVSL
jgi:GNAT superfamily N-acetyltransferase